MEMTFKERTHRELETVLPQTECCAAAFLSALCKVSGSIEIARKRVNLCVQLDSYEQGMLVVGLFKMLYPAEFELNIETAKSGMRAGKKICILRVPCGFTKQVLIDLGLMSADGDQLTAFSDKVPEKLLSKECCKIAYLKGLYMACGSVYVPSVGDAEQKKGGYHFELQFSDEGFALDVMELLSDISIFAKTSERGEHRLVYVKDKDEILKILAVMGLADSVLKLQAIIDERETANSINRAIICETANMDKTFAASSKHLWAIGVLEDKIGLDNLPVQLRQTADARLEYQQASLSELADILGVSKSCLNHRLRKLVELAQED